MTEWTLTGQPAGTGSCEECGRGLVARYEVTHISGATKIVGRGCLKAVTGWTLTAAQAQRALRQAGVNARRDARWAEFAQASPDAAAAITADVKAASRYLPPALAVQSVSHEIRFQVREGHAGSVARYMAGRASLPWVAA